MYYAGTILEEKKIRMKSYLSIVSLFILLLISCGPATMESEVKNWNRNQKTVERLAVEYPNFSTVLKKEIVAATAQWDKSMALPEGESKVAALGGANRRLLSPFVQTLNRMEGEIQELTKLMSSVAQAASQKEDQMAVEVAIKRAKAAIELGKQDLRNARPSNAVDARYLVDKVKRSIEGGQKSLKDIKRRIDQKKRKKAQQEKVVKEEVKAEKEAAATYRASEEAKRAPIKCSYCGRMNKPTDVTCGGCGANVKRK